VKVHDLSDTSVVADALVCQEAALLLRAGEASPDGEDLAPPMDRLLSAVGAELETGRESLPEAVRRAAVDLAAHLVRRSSVPVPGGPARHGHGFGARPGSGRRRSAPFTPSIRLGRMG
jgi:hypothetical protein